MEGSARGCSERAAIAVGQSILGELLEDDRILYRSAV